MTERRTFILRPSPHPARENAAKAVLAAPDGHSVRIGPAPKSRPQEEKYHSQIGDLSRQWAAHGKLRDEETMKRLCIDQFWRDTKDDPDLREHWQELGELQNLPSIDGTGVVSIGWQSRKFPKPLASAFIEWLYALGAEVGCEWTESETEAA